MLPLCAVSYGEVLLKTLQDELQATGLGSEYVLGAAGAELVTGGQVVLDVWKCWKLSTLIHYLSMYFYPYIRVSLCSVCGWWGLLVQVVLRKGLVENEFIVEGPPCQAFFQTRAAVYSQFAFLS